MTLSAEPQTGGIQLELLTGPLTGPTATRTGLLVWSLSTAEFRGDTPVRKGER